MYTYPPLSYLPGIRLANIFAHKSLARLVPLAGETSSRLGPPCFKRQAKASQKLGAGLCRTAARGAGPLLRCLRPLRCHPQQRDREAEPVLRREVSPTAGRRTAKLSTRRAPPWLASFSAGRAIAGSVGSLRFPAFPKHGRKKPPMCKYTRTSSCCCQILKQKCFLQF